MLYLPLYKTATGQRTFYFRTVKLWNSLDPALKLKPTLKDFKSCRKKNLTLKFLEATRIPRITPSPPSLPGAACLGLPVPSLAEST